MKNIKAKLNLLFKISGLGFIVMFFGTYAGSDGTSKAWRRIAIPVTFFITSLFSVLSFWNITLLVQYVPFCFGHGIPSVTDEGSRFGRIFYKLCKGNDFWTNFCMRSFIAFLLSLCFIGIVIVKQNWITYISCSSAIIMIFGLWQWRNLGTYEFKFFGKTFYACVSDMIAYGALGIFGSLIIF